MTRDLRLLAFGLICALVGGIGLAMLWSGCSKTAPHSDPTREEFANADLAKRAADLHAVGALGQKVYGPTHGMSMEPLIYQGDFLVLQVRAFSEVREGKCYGYLPKAGADFPNLPADYDSLPVHRAVQNTKDGWLMSGDNAPRSDSNVRMTAANMVGELIYVAHVRR